MMKIRICCTLKVGFIQKDPKQVLQGTEDS